VGVTGDVPGKPKYVKQRKKTRRSNRKSAKKSCNFQNGDNKWSILHSNIRGFNSKKHSFLSIINGVNPNLVTINELGYKKDKKLSIPGYLCYNRNRACQNMGGVATAIRKDEQIYSLKVDEGIDNDEFILTRHSQFNPPINVLNIYGEIESRSNVKEIEERWCRLLEIVSKIESRNEAIILIGDMNKAVGNGEYGVQGNTNKVSFGGKMIHNFLSGGK
jgi:exonuclease III